MTNDHPVTDAELDQFWGVTPSQTEIDQQECLYDALRAINGTPYVDREFLKAVISALSSKAVKEYGADHKIVEALDFAYDDI